MKVEKYEASTKDITLKFENESVTLDLSSETDNTRTVTVIVSGNDSSEASVTYSSSNGVATVDPSTGKVTAVKIGVATITAIDSVTESSATYEVRVEQKEATEEMSLTSVPES